MSKLVSVPRETYAGERRVAATPDTVTRLLKLGFDVVIEQGAGVDAGFDDVAYEAAGARIVDLAAACRAPRAQSERVRG